MQIRHKIHPYTRLEKIPLMDRSKLYIVDTVNTDLQDLHYHTCIEIGLCLCGSGIFFVSGEIYPFKQGDISIVYDNEQHDAYRSRDVHTQWLFLFVSLSNLFEKWPDLELLQSSVSPDRHQGRILSPEEGKTILPYLRKLMKLHDVRISQSTREWIPSGRYERILPLTACMLYELHDYTYFEPEEQPKDTGRSHWQVIQPAVHYMFIHYAEACTTEKMCTLCFVTPTYLRRLFVEVLGESPIAFLHKIRIHHACAAITSTEDSILSISERCGYNSLSSFNRQFQRIMHLTPSEYRKQSRLQNSGMGDTDAAYFTAFPELV